MKSQPYAKQRQLSIWALTMIGAGLIVTLIAATLVSSRPISSLHKPQLDKLNESLSSYAAESNLLAEQYQQRRVPQTFAKQASLNLHLAVSKLGDELQQKTVDPAADQQADQLLEQAAKLQAALSDLSRLPGPGQIDQVVSAIHKVQHQLAVGQ